MANNARIPDIATFWQAGINPKTGLPVKLDAGEFPLKNAIKRALRVNDEQVAINRYKWYNLPGDLDGQLIERILYYKGQGAFFYMKELGKWFFLPYALDGTIDCYGRYTGDKSKGTLGITPLPFTGSTGATEKDRQPWIKGLSRKPVYSVFGVDEPFTEDDFNNSCVLLSDYSKQLSQTVIPRQALNEEIINLESDMLPFMRTALLNSTGINGMRVNSQDEYAAVEQASRSINEAALAGRKYVPILGQLDFQDLTPGQVAKAEEFLMSMQGIDNFRLGTMGVENGGLFQKKAHELQSEANMNMGGGVGPIMQDGLTNRQTMCDIANSIWGLGIWCEPSETQAGDMNMNGMEIDEQDQSGTMEGEQPPEVME